MAAVPPGFRSPSSGSFDVKFKLLPPDLIMRLWVLALDADTSRVAVAWSPGPGGFTTNLKYNYGGALDAAVSVRRAQVSLGFNPTNPDHPIDLGLVYKGFRFTSGVDVPKRSVSVKLGFGRELLPFPDQLSSVFDAANGGLFSMAGSISQAPSNPLQWFQMHSNDVNAISKAVSTVQKIGGEANSSSGPIGADLRLSFTPQAGFTIYGTVGISF
jgi:hypothetical protein